MTDSLRVTVALADYNHILTARVCKRSRFYLLFKNYPDVFRAAFSIPHGILCLLSVMMRNCENYHVFSHVRQFTNRPTCCKDGNFTSIYVTCAALTPIRPQLRRKIALVDL